MARVARVVRCAMRSGLLAPHQQIAFVDLFDLLYLLEDRVQVLRCPYFLPSLMFTRRMSTLLIGAYNKSIAHTLDFTMTVEGVTLLHSNNAVHPCNDAS